MRKFGRRLTSFLLTAAIVASALLTAVPQRVAAAERATVALWNSLVPLKSVNTFMNTGAHPDDENSSLLAYVSLGLGARTLSMIANRGEGGQNAIGTEYVTALGVVRSRELQEASKVTGVEVIHLGQELEDSIWDFGFSKTPEETLEVWGKDVAMERLVRVIRETRPDVVMPSFRDEHGQHGHHRAVTVMTFEAFEAAADPEAYPEQLEEGLRPWQVKKLYLPASSGGGGVYLAGQGLETTLEVSVGEYDAILGANYVQLGEESRFYHESQGMGNVVAEGPAKVRLNLAKSAIAAADKEASLFDGLPQTVGDLAGTVTDADLKAALTAAQSAIDRALAAYPNNKAVAAALTDALVQVRAARARGAQVLGLDSEAGYDLDHRLGLKEEQLQAALAQAVLLVTRFQTSQYELTRGSSATFTLSAFVGGPVAVEKVKLDLQLPKGWTAQGAAPETAALQYNQTARASFTVTVPEGADYFHPYRPHEILGQVSFEVFGVPVTTTVAPEKLVAVLPDLSLRIDPDGVIYNLDKPAPFTFNVVATSYKDGSVDSVLIPKVPAGWKASPAWAKVEFSKRGEVQAATFTITPPEGLAAGNYPISIVAQGKADSDSSVRVIEYDHIGRTYMVQPTKLDVQAFSLKVGEGLKVGYVSGGADSVPTALRQMGVDVELLDADTLAFGDLSAYDTIVVGIRAYRTRPDLAAANSRLLEYVKAGGNLVVQYHQPADGWNADTTAPYRLKIGSPSFDWRVTDENSEVRLLQPEHPVLTTPNAIGEADWQGWIKERGLYFPMEWAPEFTPILSMNDAGEKPLDGSLLVAKYGEGRYIYTSLILYYEMEQRVPGAFRLFANLITPEQ